VVGGRSLDRAKEIIALWGLLEADSANFKSLYQNVADLIFPRENQITTITSPGAERNTSIANETGIMAKDEMATGLSINLFPPGQKFYNILMSDRALNDISHVKQALGQITEISHAKRDSSNFRLEAGESLKSIAAFGTCNTYSEYLPGVGLNYKDWDVGQYQIIQNNLGRIDGVMMKWQYTAIQAVEEFGIDAVGEKIREALDDEKTATKKFTFYELIRPRKKRNPGLEDNLNMPFEKVIVNHEQTLVVKEGGYKRFPNAVGRWSKSSGESWGRGQGVMALPAVRQLQQMEYDLVECANKWNNPPYETLDSFEGIVNVVPGADNRVSEMGSIRAIDRGMRGSFPITKELLEFKEDRVRKIFLNDVFVPLVDLTGDRRTTLEIRERIAEGLRRLGTPVARLQEEWIRPLVVRDIFLLLDNGEFPELPPEIQGKSFKIDFIGPIALELKNQQAQGFLRWAGYGAELEDRFPGITDNVNYDSGYRRLGETLGVSVEDIRTPEEIEGRREARQAELDRQKAMEIAQVAAQGYPGATKAPEEGSAAEMLMGV